MLPIFPNFKNIEISDKTDVEKITSQFAPYSDFDFYSLWSWDVQGIMEISDLNNNLIVKFTDYVSGDFFYSFIGTNKVKETVHELLELSKKEGLKLKLKLIPESVAKELDQKKFKLIESLDHFDYLASVEKLMPHDGTERKLSSRRRLIKKYKENNTIEIKEINIWDKEIENKIRDVYIRWEIQMQQGLQDVEHLREALNRFFMIPPQNNIKSFGVFLENELIGYSINSVYDNGYAVGHFQQGDVTKFSGIYALLMHETAPFFNSYGCKFINLEQDLGIMGLRNWKTSMRPVGYLKKFEIELVEKKGFVNRWIRSILKS